MCAREDTEARRTPPATVAGQNPSAFSEDATCVFRNRAGIWYAHYCKALKGAVQCAAAAAPLRYSQSYHQPFRYCLHRMQIKPRQRAVVTRDSGVCHMSSLPHEWMVESVDQCQMMIKRGGLCAAVATNCNIAHTWYKKFILSYASRFAIRFGGFDMAAVAHQQTKFCLI